MDYLIDQAAKDVALRHFRGGECLHIPIAAVDVDAIRDYIGEILQEFGRGSPPKAVLVRIKEPPPIDRRYPVWELEASKVFHQPVQLWVNVGYSGYRRAHRKAFPSEDISDKILSHAMNRRVALLKGFNTRGLHQPRVAQIPAAPSPRAGRWHCIVRLHKWR